MELKGTREIIFDISIQLFQALGFENVGLRNIAANVGVKASSLYNHFSSKQEILSSIYDYYEEHIYDTRKSFEEIKDVIAKGSAEEIINAISYTFESLGEKGYMRMVLITKIIDMRIFQDKRAAEIFLSVNAKSCEYIIELLNYAIKIGRLDESFDKEIYAEVLVGAREIMGVRAFVDPSYALGQLEKEKRILSILSQSLALALK